MVKNVLLLTCVLLMSCSGAFAYDFWGISLGTETYDGAQQLAFSGVASSGVQYAVGSYKWTKVDSAWLGPNAAASPGLGYNDIHRTFDAMGLFFKPTADAANFLIFTGMPQTGATAASAGYGTREFGPGDLKIDIGSNTYGVGLRLSDLVWAVESTTSPYFQIYKATGGIDDINARDTGTLGDVELNPQWDHVDHYGMAANDPAGYAFYVSGTGTAAGSATVSFSDTGLTLGTGNVYVYEASIPWAVLGVDAGSYSLQASWRPDCGNDMLVGSFAGTTPPRDVPEPMSLFLAISGLASVAVARRRMK